MTVHQYTREGNLLKPTKIPRKRIVVAKVCGETYFKNEIRGRGAGGRKRDRERLTDSKRKKKD